MKSCKYFVPVVSLFAMALICSVAPVLHAQDPPHIEITKQIETEGEICPGDIIDISITLTGAGSVGHVREPLDAVLIIDKSGSMTWGVTRCYIDDPWGITGTEDYAAYGPPVTMGCPWPWNLSAETRQSPYVNTVWAAWRFYHYLAITPPSPGYEDYGGLIFYGSNSYPSGVPGAPYAVTQTSPPISIQAPEGLDPYDFWWLNHLEPLPSFGSTAMGCGMQLGKEMLQNMPTHPPVVWSDPTGPPVTGKRYMIVMTDGHPNQYWTPSAAYLSTGPGWTNPDTHCLEMAKRTSLGEPWGPYTDCGNAMIFAIGLGSAVDGSFMWKVADPFYPGFSGSTPTPSNAKHGTYFWVQHENDLEEVFLEIAQAITFDRAGKDIEIHEIFDENVCSPIYADIIGWWSDDDVTPVATPHPDYPTCTGTPNCSPEWIWHFKNNLRVGESVTLYLTLAIDPEAPYPNETFYLECPESHIEFIDYKDTPTALPIENPPGFQTGICATDTPGYTSTPTPTTTPTTTPTCVVTVLWSENLESGDFSNFDPDGWGPPECVRVLDDARHSFEGAHSIFFAGSEDYPVGDSRAHVNKSLSFNDPIYRQGVFLTFWIRLDELTGPEKSGEGGTRDSQYDQFYVEAVGYNGGVVTRMFDIFDQIATDSQWFPYQMDLTSLAGDPLVLVRFISNFNLGVPDPDPDDMWPKTFIDDIRIEEMCYTSPTPMYTCTPAPPIPATSTSSLLIIVILVTLTLVIPLLRR
ncbi:hypothetical protein JXA40_01555 [bacterium]|nr:hypothetical protein [candidate division CSSED10-310 bacterium]